MVSLIKNQTKLLDYKEEKILSLEELNRNAKSAYSSLIDEMKKK